MGHIGGTADSVVKSNERVITSNEQIRTYHTELVKGTTEQVKTATEQLKIDLGQWKDSLIQYIGSVWQTPRPQAEESDLGKRKPYETGYTSSSGGSQTAPVTTSSSWWRFTAPAPPPPRRVLIIRTHGEREGLAPAFNEEAQRNRYDLQFTEVMMTREKTLPRYTAKDYNACLFVFFSSTVRWYENLNKSLYEKASSDFPVTQLVCLRETHVMTPQPLMKYSGSEMDVPASIIYYNGKLNPGNAPTIKILVDGLQKATH